MKALRLLAVTCLCLALSSVARSQDPQQNATSPKDTLILNFLEMLDKGDVIPFHYVYNRARLGIDTSGGEFRLDTTLTLSVTKHIELEVVENNKEEEFVVFEMITSDFQKAGEEAGNAFNARATCVVSDGFPIRIIVDYNGSLSSEEYSDTLKARVEKNLLYVADTLLKFNPGLTKEEIADNLSFLKNQGFAITQAINGNDFSNMFSFFRWVYPADEVFTSTDSVHLSNTSFDYTTYFIWDAEFSKERPQFENFHVLRSIVNINGNPALAIMGIKPDENTSKLLEEETFKARSVYAKQVTLLADKGMCIPSLLDIEILHGFYDDIEDLAMSLEKTIITLDIEKLIGDQSDDEEDEDDDEPRYDDYGFIKVK